MTQPASQTLSGTDSLVMRIAHAIRDAVTSGQLLPGQRLSEATLARDYDVSRNTLREAFRLLSAERLLRHEPNRGVFVVVPDHAAIIDIYRVRRVIECDALLGASPGHPAARQMREAVKAARVLGQAGDWQGVGSANMQFHAAIVDLADSARLSGFYAQMAAELRLAFGLLDDPVFLHAPFIDQNAQVLAALEDGRPEEAARLLQGYLDQSERLVLGALSRAVSV